MNNKELSTLEIVFEETKDDIKRKPIKEFILNKLNKSDQCYTDKEIYTFCHQWIMKTMNGNQKSELL